MYFSKCLAIKKDKYPVKSPAETTAAIMPRAHLLIILYTQAPGSKVCVCLSKEEGPPVHRQKHSPSEIFFLKETYGFF